MCLRNQTADGNGSRFWFCGVSKSIILAVHVDKRFFEDEEERSERKRLKKAKKKQKKKEKKRELKREKKERKRQLRKRKREESSEDEDEVNISAARVSSRSSSGALIFIEMFTRSRLGSPFRNRLKVLLKRIPSATA